MGLKINRDKPRVIDLRCQGTALDFLGYTFRYDRDRQGTRRCYLNVTISRRRSDGSETSYGRGSVARFVLSR